MSFNNIKIIPDYSFRNNSELRRLKLDHNEIERLTADVFRGLFKLDILKLSFNKIQYLPLYLFHDLENLKALELNDNMIEVISAGQFVTNKQLTHIYLHNNAISIIDDGAFDDILTTLEEINLKHNTCVNGRVLDNETKDLTKLIECCSTSSKEMKSCLASTPEQDDGSGAWVIFIILIILANVSLFAYIGIKRRNNILNFSRLQEEHIELRGSIVHESGSSGHFLLQ
jgi:hypothetical protein